MKTYIQIGFVVVALAVAALLAVKTLSSGSSGRDQGTGVISVKVVSAADVLANYTEYATKPDEGLKGLWFVVHGKVKDFHKQPNGDIAIILDTGNERVGVECVLKNAADAKKVKIGDEVGIAGKGAPGAMGNIPMLDCWVLPPEEWQGKKSTKIDVGA